MAKDFSLMEDSNRSSNPSIHDVSDPSRRQVLRGGLGALASSFFAPLSAIVIICFPLSKPVSFQTVVASSGLSALLGKPL